MQMFTKDLGEEEIKMISLLYGVNDNTRRSGGLYIS
jgi:hypothetical protein